MSECLWPDGSGREESPVNRQCRWREKPDTKKMLECKSEVINSRQTTLNTLAEIIEKPLKMEWVGKEMRHFLQMLT